MLTRLSETNLPLSSSKMLSGFMSLQRERERGGGDKEVKLDRKANGGVEF